MRNLFQYSFLFVLACLYGCGTPSNITDVPYFQNSREVSLQTEAGLHEMVIRPKDALHVFVHAKDDNSVAALNKRERRAMDPAKGHSDNTQSGFYHYLVDYNGEIDYPMIGKVKVV